MFTALSVLRGGFVGGEEDLGATWHMGELGHRKMIGKTGRLVWHHSSLSIW